jgi:hypothetical protein
MDARTQYYQDQTFQSGIESLKNLIGMISPKPIEFGPFKTTGAWRAAGRKINARFGGKQ